MYYSCFNWEAFGICVEDQADRYWGILTRICNSRATWTYTPETINEEKLDVTQLVPFRGEGYTQRWEVGPGLWALTVASKVGEFGWMTKKTFLGERQVPKCRPSG